MFKTSNSISNKTNELTSDGSVSAGAGEGTRNILYSLLEWLKNNRTSINGVKLFGLLIINTWLLILFWKIFMLEGINVVGNNIALTKMQTLMQPVLMYLGLEMLSPSSIKLIIFSTIVITVNIIVLNFNKVVILSIPLGIARYGYKMHSNYLISQENIAVMNQKALEIVPKVVEKAPLIVNTGQSSGTNWWLWGGIIVIGVIATVALGYSAWSHHVNSTNLASSINDNISVYNNMNTQINNVNERVSLLSNLTGYQLREVNKKIDLVNVKVENLSNTISGVSQELVKVQELPNDSLLKLSQQSLTLSENANVALSDIAQSTSTVEATTLGLVKVFELVKDYMLKVDNLEARIDSISNTTTSQTPVTTPCSMSTMYKLSQFNISKPGSSEN